jgi:hypothetical protein
LPVELADWLFRPLCLETVTVDFVWWESDYFLTDVYPEKLSSSRFNFVNDAFVATLQRPADESSFCGTVKSLSFAKEDCSFPVFVDLRFVGSVADGRSALSGRFLNFSAVSVAVAALDEG